MYPLQVYAVVAVLAAFGLSLIAVRLSVRRWVRWAHRAADYGATDILNAAAIDSDDAVARLRAEFEAWSIVVKDGTARFCQEEDAQRVHLFATPASMDAAGFNDEHRYIRDATAERVRRLLELASRLEHGQTELRQRWVPRLG